MVFKLSEVIVEELKPNSLFEIRRRQAFLSFFQLVMSIIQVDKIK